MGEQNPEDLKMGDVERIYVIKVQLGPPHTTATLPRHDEET